MPIAPAIPAESPPQKIMPSIFSFESIVSVKNQKPENMRIQSPILASEVRTEEE